jgi:hypothetical protein
LQFSQSNCIIGSGVHFEFQISTKIKKNSDEIHQGNIPAKFVSIWYGSFGKENINDHPQS